MNIGLHRELEKVRWELDRIEAETMRIRLFLESSFTKEDLALMEGTGMEDGQNRSMEAKPNEIRKQPKTEQKVQPVRM